MRKLNLASLAQNEVTKDEAQRAKGGLYCICECICECPWDMMLDARFPNRTEERTFVSTL